MISSRSRSRASSRARVRRAAAAAAVLLLGLAFALGGCSASSTGGSGGGSAATSAGTAGGATAAAGRAPATGAGSSPPRAGSLEGAGSLKGAGSVEAAGVPVVSPRVVKTGTATLDVPARQVGATLARVTALAALEHGYVAASRSDESAHLPSGEVTLRVPVARFEDTVNRIRALGSGAGRTLAHLDTSSEDVTSRYVDLRARIHSLQRSRESFLTLLGAARTIGQTLEVQQRVDDVQTQIEQLQGQLNVLADTSAMSTLTVDVETAGRPAVTPQSHRSGLVAAVHLSVRRFLDGLAVLVAAIGPVLLVLLVTGLVLAGVRFGYRVLRRRLV